MRKFSVSDSLLRIKKDVSEEDAEDEEKMEHKDRSSPESEDNGSE